MRRWEEIFTEADRKLAQKIGMGMKQDYGKKPALLIIDVTKRFVGSSSKSALESAEEFRSSCGEAGWAALSAIQKLLKACRADNIPVIYSVPDAITRQTFGTRRVKGGVSKDDLDAGAQEIPEAIAPVPSDYILKKLMPSCFFGTPVATLLRAKGIDTLLFVGDSTSGCVRAAVADAFYEGFICIVVEEGTFDRFELSHLVNLWDMNAKYADVITLEEAMSYVAKVGRHSSVKP